MLASASASDSVKGDKSTRYQMQLMRGKKERKKERREGRELLSSSSLSTHGQNEREREREKNRKKRKTFQTTQTLFFWVFVSVKNHLFLFSDFSPFSFLFSSFFSVTNGYQ